ncbi:MAG: hypothetical protein K5695_02600 [Oscillospiraceae bacterium]|nr:hypothetical protein [Oscillospiraceae bacterium]
MKPMRIAALLTAAICLLSLSACSKRHGMTYTEEELPYGGTMRQNKTSYAVPITYDRRFLNEEQAEVVAGLLGGIQNADAELYTKSTLDFYADYQLKVYEQDNKEAMVQLFHDNLAKQTGDDFTFTMVLINGLAQDRNNSDIASMLTLLDGINEDSGKFSDTVEEAYKLTLEWDINYSGGYKVLEDETIYLLKTPDGYFAVM